MQKFVAQTDLVFPQITYNSKS